MSKKGQLRPLGIHGIGEYPTKAYSGPYQTHSNVQDLRIMADRG